MTYLSRLTLNVRSRAVQRDLADCQQLHRSILRAFPDTGGDGRAANEVLFRVEDAHRLPRVLVQSSAEPDWARLAAGYLAQPPECKRIDDAYGRLGAGSVLAFRLQANPTKRVFREAARPGQRSWVGKRVNLVREADRIGWLERKGSLGGFELIAVRVLPQSAAERDVIRNGGLGSNASVPNVRVQPGGKLRGHRGSTPLTFGSVLFEGMLRVTDPDAFRQTLTQGVGSGKAYGFGLLSIAPTRT